MCWGRGSSPTGTQAPFLSLSLGVSRPETQALEGTRQCGTDSCLGRQWPEAMTLTFGLDKAVPDVFRSHQPVPTGS